MATELIVKLHVYDLSMGISRQYSELLAGKHFDAVYHTGVVVGGREYYYGDGINDSPAGITPYGRPVEVLDMGATSKTLAEINAFLDEKRADFTSENYNLISHNCNHFSNAFLIFLVGKSVPERIVNQGREFLETPLGQMVAPLLQYGPGSSSFPRGTGTLPASSAPPPLPSTRPAGASASKKSPAASTSDGKADKQKYPGIALDEPKAYLNKQPTLQSEAADLGSCLADVLGISQAMAAVDAFSQLVDAVCDKRDYAVAPAFLGGLDNLLHAQLDGDTPRPPNDLAIHCSLDILACVCLTSSVVDIPVSVQPYYCILNYSSLPSADCKEALLRYANNWAIQIPGMRCLRQNPDPYLGCVATALREPSRGVRLMACRALYNASRALTAADVGKHYAMLEALTCPPIEAAANAEDADRKPLAAPANLMCGALGRCLLTVGPKSPAFGKAQRRLRDLDFSRLEGPCARDLKLFLGLNEALSGDDELF